MVNKSLSNTPSLSHLSYLHLFTILFSILFSPLPTLLPTLSLLKLLVFLPFSLLTLLLTSLLTLLPVFLPFSVRGWRDRGIPPTRIDQSNQHPNATGGRGGPGVYGCT